jgi:hypothetical protein
LALHALASRSNFHNPELLKSLRPTIGDNLFESCFSDVPASGMYFLTYEWIKKKVAATAPKDKPASKTREMGGTILAGGMGEISNQTSNLSTRS